MTSFRPDADSGRSLPRRWLDALGDRASLIYLAVCAALLVWALVDSTNESPDASLAVVIPMLATAPSSFVLFFLPDGAAMVVVAVVFGALVNATVIGLLARILRKAYSTDLPS